MDRILWNTGGKTVDEIVVTDCTVHLEQQADNSYWIGISKAGKDLAVNITTKRAPISVVAEEDLDGWHWDEDREHEG